MGLIFLSSGHNVLCTVQMTLATSSVGMIAKVFSPLLFLFFTAYESLRLVKKPKQDMARRNKSTIKCFCKWYIYCLLHSFDIVPKCTKKSNKMLMQRGIFYNGNRFIFKGPSLMD